MKTTIRKISKKDLTAITLLVVFWIIVSILFSLSRKRNREIFSLAVITGGSTIVEYKGKTYEIIEDVNNGISFRRKFIGKTEDKSSTK